MKTFTITLVAVLVSMVKCSASESLIGAGIKEIISEYFASESQAKVDFVLIGDDDGLSSEILRNVPDSMTFTISKVDAFNRDEIQLKISSIVLFASPEFFKENVGRVKWLSDKRKRYKHLVYFPHATIDEIMSTHTAETDENIEMDNVNFLIEKDENSVELVSSFMFTKEKCRSYQLKTINEFSRKSMRWANSNFYPDKYQNLHGCTLTVCQTENGMAVQHIFDEFATRHNFKMKFLRSTEQELTTKMSSCDLIDMFQEFDKFKYWVSADPHIIEVAKFGVPPGEPYTTFEKMFLMFDLGLWIAIVATFVILLSSIQVVSRFSLKVQNFVFGRNIRTPTMNLLEIFLCGAQHRVPTRNFARFTLILFIIWSLIIRTCYQSMLFKLLQDDIRKPHFTTMQQLVDRNFTMYHGRNVSKFEKMNVVQCFGSACYNIVAEPANRGTMIISPNIWSAIHNEAKNVGLTTYRSGVSSIQFLDKNYRTLLTSIVFRPFSPYFETLNARLGQFMSNGLNEYWLKNLCHPKGYERKSEPIGPQVLTMDHLGVGFLICLIPLSFACIAFVCEVGYPASKTLARFIRDTLVACFAVRSFVKLRSLRNFQQSTRRRNQ